MADALNPVGNIHEGFWTDWTRSTLFGCTLTLRPTFATVLTNSLAMWVTLCGIQLWTIIRYTLYQRGEPVKVRTPNLSGQQVILKNSGSALATFYLMFSWAWNTRSSTGKRSVRAYAIAISAGVYYIMFTVAGVVSNNAITAPQINNSSAVLLRNSHCGVWNQTIYDIVELGQYTDAYEFDMFLQNVAKKSYELQLSLEYAQECYLGVNDTTDLSSNCKTLKKNVISQNSASTLSCPFASQICLEDTDTIVFDTGDVDSHEDFGINSIPQDRLTYRRVTTCTVLNSTSYVDGWNGTLAIPSGPKPLPQAAHANYGPNIPRRTNWTYSYSNFASFYDNYSVDATKSYQIGIVVAPAPTDPQWTSSDFEPIQELAQETADITLAFLSFTGMYLGQVDDPWFLAGNKQCFDSPLPFTRERYTRDTAISTLGCKEQHRFCTNDKVCTDFLGFDQVQNNGSFNAILTPRQNATFDRIIRAAAYSSLRYVVNILAKTNAPLLAAQGAFDGNSGITLSKILPDDQWKLELDRWQKVAMAQLQRQVARWATGQIAASPDYLLTPTNPQDIWFCGSLIVSSAVYTSFSVFAITLIIVLGCLIIFAGFFVDGLASFLRRSLKRSAPRRPWDRDDMIELQRRKTVAPHRPPPATSQNGTHCAPTRPSRPAEIVESQGIPQWHYARLSRANPRSVPPAVHQTGLQPPTQSTRQSWMTISLCSVESSSARRPLRTDLGGEQTPRHEPLLPRMPAAITQHSYARMPCSPTYTQYPEWV